MEKFSNGYYRGVSNGKFASVHVLCYDAKSSNKKWNFSARMGPVTNVAKHPHKYTHTHTHTQHFS